MNETVGTLLFSYDVNVIAYVVLENKMNKTVGTV